MKLFRGIPIEAHSPQMVVVRLFAFLPTKVSNGDVVWLEWLRWTLEKSGYSIGWVCTRRERECEVKP